MKKFLSFILVSVLLAMPINLVATNSSAINSSNINLSTIKLQKTNYFALATTLINFLSNIFGRVSAPVQTPANTITQINQQAGACGVDINHEMPVINATPSTQAQTQATIANPATANSIFVGVGSVLSEVNTVLNAINTVYQATHQKQGKGNSNNSHLVA